MTPDEISRPERIHPGLWRASQLSHAYGRCVDTGYAGLSRELPGGGWPLGSLIEFLVRQPGSGELQVLRPALGRLSTRSTMLVQPPHPPQTAAWANWGYTPSSLIWVRARRSSDALWTAEQVLRAGTVGALIVWQDRVRNQALRRLQLAAQTSDTLFVLMRPAAAAEQFSPAPLRLALEPTPQGLNISIIKRRGATHEGPLLLPFYRDIRFSEFDHEIVGSRAFVARKPGYAQSELAH